MLKLFHARYLVTVASLRYALSLVLNLHKHTQ